MGRFATTVALYEELRPPYPPAFFRSVAQKLGLGREHALIDLGTGPGLLALGFGPYVGRIVGVDPEPAMITAARKAAGRASQALTLIEGKAEALPADIGSFDVVTVGRALHWMDRDAALALFERLVAAEGVVVVCSSHSPPAAATRGSTNTTRRCAPGRRRACGRSPAANESIGTLRPSFAAPAFTSRI
jgi:ubiquinone/menaquinone biosynthesis C-methylase UbiE